MARVTVNGFVVSARPVAKYPDWEIPYEALEQLAAALRAGQVPLTYEHDETQPIEATVTDARVVRLDDGHHAVEVAVDFDADEWSRLEQDFDSTALAGFSFRATAPQFESKSGASARVSLAADAAAWTDDDRAEAGAALDAVLPTRTELLFEYSKVEIATIVLTLAEGVTVGIIGSAAYDAIKRLLGRWRGETRIEIHRHTPHGEVLKAVVVTSDPEIAREALRALEAEPDRGNLTFDPTEKRWLER